MHAFTFYQYLRSNACVTTLTHHRCDLFLSRIHLTRRYHNSSLLGATAILRQTANLDYITEHPEHSDRTNFGEYWPHSKSGLPKDGGEYSTTTKSDTPQRHMLCVLFRRLSTHMHTHAHYIQAISFRLTRYNVPSKSVSGQWRIARLAVVHPRSQ
jgi:hypothetical protein